MNNCGKYEDNEEDIEQLREEILTIIMKLPESKCEKLLKEAIEVGLIKL